MGVTSASFAKAPLWRPRKKDLKEEELMRQQATVHRESMISLGESLGLSKVNINSSILSPQDKKQMGEREGPPNFRSKVEPGTMEAQSPHQHGILL